MCVRVCMCVCMHVHVCVCEGRGRVMLVRHSRVLCVFLVSGTLRCCMRLGLS